MPKKKLVTSEVTGTPVVSTIENTTVISQIGKLTVSLPSEDLTKVVDKINEIIDKLNE